MINIFIRLNYLKIYITYELFYRISFYNNTNAKVMIIIKTITNFIQISISNYKEKEK